MFCHQCGRELSAKEEAQGACDACGWRIQPPPQRPEQPAQPAVKPPKTGGFFKRNRVWLALIVVVAAAAGIYFGTADLRAYQHAKSLYEQGAYEQAIASFEPIASYRDARQWMEKSYYELGRQAYEEQAYEPAIGYLEQAGDAEQAEELLHRCQYDYGHSLFLQGAYDRAQTYLDELGEDADEYGPAHFASVEQARETIIAQALDTEPTIRLYIGDLDEVMDTADGRRGLINVAQSERGAITCDAQDKLLTITPTYYPGIRIAKAWRTGDFRSLNADEQATYERAKTVVAQAKAETSGTLELERWLNDYLCAHVAYTNEGSPADDLSLARNWTAVGALLDGKANCQGFADAFYLLGTMAGYEVRYQFGQGGNELHVWNVIELDGQWYNVDVTYNNGLDVIEKAPRTYAYLNFAADANAEHTPRVYSEVAEIAPNTPAALDEYRAQGQAYGSLQEAADACIRQRQSDGRHVVYVRVDNVSYSSEQMSEALKSLLSQRGIAASWMVYSNALKNSVTFTVQWQSFQG